MITGCLTLEEKEAVEEVLRDFPGCMEPLALHFYHVETGLAVERKGKEARVGFSTRASLMRGAAMAARQEGAHARETPAFSFLGAMVDCSRNGVMHAEAVRKMCRLTARMGFNALMLYTEDTYEVEGYPYFGYMRGRYSREELRELDAYAAFLGIELVGCIQTLAHLAAPLRWPSMSGMKDVNDILLADDENTYRLIDAMLGSVAQNLTSRRVHIGMDEAHMLGLGKYLQQHGYRQGFEIMNRHLSRVADLCKKHGLSPIMWADMYFRMFADDKGYYNIRTQIPQEVMDGVPPQITLCYWDYYDTDPQVYDIMMEKHQKFRNPLMFAGGAWIWAGLAPLNRFSLHAARAALGSVRRKGVREVMVTLWGDDGAEGSRFASLTTLQAYAEACWNGHMEEEALAPRLLACAGAVWEDVMALSLPNFPPHRKDQGDCIQFPTRALLYQDVLAGLYDRHVAPGDGAFYGQCADELKQAARRNPLWAYVFEAVEAMCRVLAVKAELGVTLKAAYDGGERETLSRLAMETLPELAGQVEALYQCVREQWLAENKSFGLEVLCIRYGGLKQRLLEAGRLIEDYLQGRRDRLEELEAPRLYADCRPEDSTDPLLFCYRNVWADITTANTI